MASIDPFDPVEFANTPPPRPDTPPVRRGFLWVLVTLCLMAALVYGIPFVLERIGYAYEAGRARASVEALAKLDQDGVIDRASEVFRLAANAVSPAVVNIRTQTFGPVSSSSVGSGVVIDKARGYIVTNNHVIQGADVIVVRVGRRTELSGKLVGADPKTDLAVIQVQGTLPADASWGDSDRLESGDWVLAIGSPFGLERTVTVGIVSATARNNLGIVGQDAYEDFIQTDASINPGNSGGPLIDLRGRVIGINTAIVSDEHSFKGIGLAISSAMARKVVDQLIRSGKVVRGYLGVMSQPVSPDQAAQAGLADGDGAAIARILPGSPADRAGLRVDDIIVGLDGKQVTDPVSLRNQAFTLAAGSDVPVEIVRGRKTETIRVKVAAMPSDPVITFFGFTVKEVPRDGDGVLAVAEVEQGSPADRAGLRPGDRVLSFGRGLLSSKAEFDVGANQFAALGGMSVVISRNGKREVVNIGAVAAPRP